MAAGDRTVLVTGSTDGIGMQTALQLAKAGFRVILHGRSKEKGRSVVEEIRRRAGGAEGSRAEFFLADLSSQRQVRRLADEIRAKHDRLDVLINNAGTYEPERTLTEDGLEKTFAVNYLAPFLLTRELLGLLKSSAPARIVNVSSIAHWSGKVDWTNLQGERHYDGFDAYALTKLCLVLFTYALARRLEGTGVTANCLHPGTVRTKLLRAGFGDYPGGPPEKGARTAVWLASSPKVEAVTGKYFENCRASRSSPQSYDLRLQERLWETSEDLTGLERWQ